MPTPSNTSDTATRDRKSTRLNSSHVAISYAVFCLKKKKGGIARARRRGARDHAKRDAAPPAERDREVPDERLRWERPFRRGVHRILVPFFFNDTATTEIYTLSLHDALPI